MKLIKPIIICGPTASGKSALALQLAQELQKRNVAEHNYVIINADSQQVYKEIPILSAQPSAEEKKLMPHYLFSEIAGNEDFNVAIWLEKTKAIISKNPASIIVGGTGMYLNALLKGLADIPKVPLAIREQVRNMDKQELLKALGKYADGNTSRMRRNLEVKLATGKYIDEFHGHSKSKTDDFIILNMNVSRETIYDNINKRFNIMVENGAVEEVRQLLAFNYPANASIMKAVGVAEIKSYLNSEITLAEVIDKASQRSRNYAKRQLTWFRHQLPEHKIDVASFDEAINLLT